MDLENNFNYKLINEEIKATKLFLWLFFIIFFIYELFYYFLIPLMSKGKIENIYTEGLGYWFHLLVIGLLPLAIYYLKSNQPWRTKYVIIFGYNLIDFIVALTIYVGHDMEFKSGNIVELLFLLFSPIFLNKRFFWFSYGTLILKLALLGLILHDIALLHGIVIMTVLAGIAYIFLYRFLSYINSLEKVNEDLRNNEKLAAVGQLATSIGHEIRNPLAALKGFTQLQYEKYPDDKGFFQIMENEIERMNLIVNDLMYIGKPKSLSLLKHDLRDIINYVVTILSQIAGLNQVGFKVDLDNSPMILCDGNQLKQVFINLIKNSIESMPTGGSVTISSKNAYEYLIIRIEDEGLGIEKEKIAMLGQPFFSTKQDGNGLGLMVSMSIIEKHNGKIVFDSKPGKGTTVEVYLPI
ncbi:ATP-binding protein [Pseudoneobacillus sp. C159]